MRTFLSRLLSTLAIVSALLAAVPPRAAHAAGIVVNWDQEPAGLLSVVPDGHCTLREAIKNANGDAQYTGADCAAGSGADTISFGSNYTIVLSMGQLNITSAITLQGPVGNYVRLQAASAVDTATWRLIEVGPSGNLTLDSISVSYGRCNGSCPTAGDKGGGIYVNGGVLTMTDSGVYTNSATYGAGIFNAGGTLVVTETADTPATSFTSNTATGDGGALYQSGGSLSLNGITISNNQASSAGLANRGGGLFLQSSNASITETTFLQNNAQEAGGGVYVEYASPTFSSTRFTSNGAGNGGGLAAYGSSPILSSVLFSGNTASANGGGLHNSGSGGPSVTNATFHGNSAVLGAGIYNESSSATLTNVTLSANTADFGGGIYNFSSNPALKNVILWGDSAPSGGPEFYNLFSTPTISYSVVQGGCALPSCTAILTADPLLQPLGGNGGTTGNMALGAGSPAIDAGTDAGCPATDQRGFSRPQGPHCDVGAFEARYLSIAGSAGTAGWGEALLSYDNGGPATVYSDYFGAYSIPVPEHWSGSVTPSKLGCTFTPTARNYSDVTSNLTSQNYSASCAIVTFQISGNVGEEGVVVTYDNGSIGTSTSTSGGDYSFTVNAHWTGTVTPAKAGCTFSPTNRTYSDVLADQSAQDYTATCTPPSVLITGNAGTGGATISYENSGPQSVTADPDGAYGFTVPNGWSGTVTPSKLDTLFAPVDRSYTNLISDTPAQDYAATVLMARIRREYPVENSTTCLRPLIGVELLLARHVRKMSGAFDPGTVTLKLDNTIVTGQSRITEASTSPASEASILFTPAVNLSAGSHTAEFQFASPLGTQTRTWNFTAANITCPTGVQQLSAPAEDPPASAPATRQLLRAAALSSAPRAAAADPAAPARQETATTQNGEAGPVGSTAATQAQARVADTAHSAPASSLPVLPWMGSWPGCGARGLACPGMIDLKK